PTTSHYPLSLHDALPIFNLTNEKDNQTYSMMSGSNSLKPGERMTLKGVVVATDGPGNPKFQIQSLIKDYGTCGTASASGLGVSEDRKSTRLNSSHVKISY